MFGFDAPQIERFLRLFLLVASGIGTGAGWWTDAQAQTILAQANEVVSPLLLLFSTGWALWASRRAKLIDATTRLSGVGEVVVAPEVMQSSEALVKNPKVTPA